MEKVIICTEKAPKAIGPYSQAIIYGDLIFTSGQIPLELETGKLVKGDIKVQTRQVLDNLKAILNHVNSDLEDVIKVTIFITDMALYPKVNEIYSLYFEKNCPSRSCVQVAGLPLGAKIEIEVIAKYHV